MIVSNELKSITVPPALAAINQCSCPMRTVTSLACRSGLASVKASAPSSQHSGDRGEGHSDSTRLSHPLQADR